MSATADGGDTDDAEFDVEAALENVAEDTELESAEKETTLRFSKATDVVYVFTAEAGLMRRFLAHPASDARTLTVVDGDRRPALTPEQYSGEEIVGVEVTLPAGGLLVPRDPRASNQHAEIVTERVFERFREGDV